MYNKFFGFKEKPFKLVPNPEYLFLTKSHEEALGHLTYAISHGDGFVEITGEVGTGKTTLCRVFLGSLDASIDAAYIFNPKLDGLQLLKAINDEFGIDSKPGNTKDLIDILNRFLIEKKAAGQKVLVLIDEAQNLSLEVLEQLRLLSNLETTQEKLLQIILVGQPELGDILSSHQLRQLGQRITINCQLEPLTFQEAKDYIRHRISLTSHRAGPPFDKASYRAIYEYSQGIPRLINIACNRVLLNAFSHNSFKITGSITKEAIQELRHKTKKIPAGPQKATAFIAPAVIAVCLIATLLYFYTANQPISPADKTNSLAGTSQPHLDAGQRVTLANPVIASDPEPSAESRALTNGETEPDEYQAETTTLTQILPAGANTFSEPDAAAENFLLFLKSLNARHSRNSSMLEALKLWNPAASINAQVNMIETDQTFFREAAAMNGLLVQPIVTDTGLDLIQSLNIPAILTFYLPNHAWPQYLTIVGVDNKNAYMTISDQGNLKPVDKSILLRFWSGEAHIVWKNFSNLNGIITKASGPASIKALKELLHALGYDNIVINNNFDSETEQLIKEIQTKNRLNADGKVGPLTKIALYNEDSSFAKPGLKQFVTAETGPAE